MKKNRILSDESRVESVVRLNRLAEVLYGENKTTKKELAAACGVGEGTFHGYLDGSSQPKQDTLGKLRQCYGVNLNWLICGDGSMFDAPTPEDVDLEGKANDLAKREASLEIREQRLAMREKDLEETAVLTPREREMRMYVKFKKELGASPESISAGLDALAGVSKPFEPEPEQNKSTEAGVAYFARESGQGTKIQETKQDYPKEHK